MAHRRPSLELVAAARAHEAYPPVVLDERDGLLVLDKPPRLQSTGRDLDDPDCLQTLAAALKNRAVWAVHQLDRDTTGVNLFVLRRSLVEPWAQALRRGRKTYLAVVDGAWTHGEEVITAPIERVDGSPRVVPTGRPTRTKVRPLATAEDASLLEVEIGTGRTHQVRIHVAHRGHPVWGDSRYGTRRDARPLLHAWKVACRGHRWVAPLPADLRAFVARPQWEGTSGKFAEVRDCGLDLPR